MEVENNEQEGKLTKDQERDINQILKTASNVFHKLTDETTLNNLKEGNLSSELENFNNAGEVLQLFQSFKNKTKSKKLEELSETVNEIKTKIEEFDTKRTQFSDQISTDDTINNDIKESLSNINQRVEELNKEVADIKKQVGRLRRRG